MKRHSHPWLALLLVTLSPGAWAADKGYIGLGISVDADGWFRPTLKAITVSAVRAGSPAAQAGLAVGDEVLEVAGRRVAGAKADDIKPLLQREVGQTLQLAVKKRSGEVRQVSVIAAAAP